MINYSLSTIESFLHPLSSYFLSRQSSGRNFYRSKHSRAWGRRMIWAYHAGNTFISFLISLILCSHLTLFLSQECFFCFHEYIYIIYKIYMHKICEIHAYINMKYMHHIFIFYIIYRFYSNRLYLDILYLRENVLHVSFSVWLISLSTMLSSPIHFNGSHFVHLCSWITLLCIHTTFLFLSSSIDWHLGWFQDLCIVTSAKINRDVQYLCCKLGLIPSHIYSGAYRWII